MRKNSSESASSVVNSQPIAGFPAMAGYAATVPKEVESEKGLGRNGLELRFFPCCLMIIWIRMDYTNDYHHNYMDDISII